VTEYPTDLPSLAARLVQIPTENPPGDEAPAAEYVHDWLSAHGIDADLVTAPDPDRPQVAARVGAGEPTLVLNAHLDVVPAGDPAAWRHDPYEGVIADGRLHGRGSVDVKTGLAIALLATRRLREAGEGTVVLQAPMGEETGAPGTRTLLERGYDGDYGVVLEPTRCRVATGARGLGWYDLTVRGEATHASQPAGGHSAVADLPAVLGAIDAYDDRIAARTDPLVGAARATVTEVVAGAESNRGVVPDAARLTLDRRVLPDETLADVDEEVAAPGTRTLLERGYDGDYGVVLEPTRCRVATGARGLGWYDLTVRGEATHASQPAGGHSAVADLPAVLGAIDAYDDRIAARTDPLVGAARATVTEVVAGAESNRGVVPDAARLTLDRRVLPDETLADVDEEVAALVAGLRDEGVEVGWTRADTYRPASVPTDCRLAATLRARSAERDLAAPEPWGIEAATDVRNLVNDAGMEAVTWGPGDLALAHGVEESIDLDRAGAALETLVAAATDLFDDPGPAADG
jgi:succinyl-diaminopimelate desuccinylase